MRRSSVGRVFLLGMGVAVVFSTASPAVRAQNAGGWTITIDAARRLGPSQVEKFLYIQGEPLLAGDDVGSDEATRQFEVAAWDALGLTPEGFWLFDPGGLIGVARGAGTVPARHRVGPLGPKHDLYLDTRNFAGALNAWRAVSGKNRELRGLPVALSYMPQALSTNPDASDFYTYPPADYAEWRAVVEAAVRFLNQQGFDDINMLLFGEPESEYVFNVLCPGGKPCEAGTERAIREYAKLYVETALAVKTADPGAQVSGMCASVYSADLQRELRGEGPGQKGLDDFIRYAAEYTAGTPAVQLAACWQGYSWKGEKRLAPMVEHVRSVLKRHGFNPDAPQYLNGWSIGWGRAEFEGQKIELYAPHLVYNVLDLLDPKKPGPIGRAAYYTWNFEGQGVWANPAKTSLVRTKHGFVSQNDPSDPQGGIASSDKNCLRPAYMGFLALKALATGNVLDTTEQQRPSLARSMAVANDTGLRALLVNYADTSQTARLTLRNFPGALRLGEAALRLVPQREACGDGNWFPSNNLATLFENAPARLSGSAPGTATAAVSLPANTVALLEIPGAAQPAGSVRDEQGATPPAGTEGTPSVTDTAEEEEALVLPKEEEAEAPADGGADTRLLIVLLLLLPAGGAGLGAWVMWTRRKARSLAQPKEPPEGPTPVSRG